MNGRSTSGPTQCVGDMAEWARFPQCGAIAAIRRRAVSVEGTARMTVSASWPGNAERLSLTEHVGEVACGDDPATVDGEEANLLPDERRCAPGCAGGPLLPGAFDSAALFADVVRSGQQQGDIPRAVDATRAGLLILDAYLGVLYRWVSDEDGRFAFEDELLATLDLVLAGITRQPPGD